MSKKANNKKYSIEECVEALKMYSKVHQSLPRRVNTKQIFLSHIEPQSVQTEMDLMCLLLNSSDTYAEVATILCPESFYEHKHKTIFEAMASIEKEGGEIDVLSVCQKLKEMGKLEETGGVPYVCSLSQREAEKIPLMFAHVIDSTHKSRQLLAYENNVSLKTMEEELEAAYKALAEGKRKQAEAQKRLDEFISKYNLL